MSFYSKEFIECRSAIEEAKNSHSVIKAVNKLDGQWRKNENVMKDSDWPKLVMVISVASERLKY